MENEIKTMLRLTFLTGCEKIAYTITNAQKK